MCGHHTGISWCIQVHLLNTEIYAQMATKVFFFLFGFVEMHSFTTLITFLFFHCSIFNN